MKKTPTKKTVPVKRTAENSEISMLRASRKAAIESLDFDTAEELAKQIREVRCGSYAKAISPIKTTFLECARIAIEQHLENVGKIETDKSDEIFRFRSQIKKEFSELKERHVKQLVTLETRFATVRVKEAQKTSPAYDELINQAKSAAAGDDYEKARKLQLQASMLQEEEANRRITKIDEESQEQTEITMNRQKIELQALVTKLNEGLASIDKKCEIKMAKEREDRDIILNDRLSKSVKEAMGVGQPGFNVQKYREDLERSLIELLNEYKLGVPKGIKQDAKPTWKQTASGPHSK